MARLLLLLPGVAAWALVEGAAEVRVDGAPVAADPPFWRARSNLIRGPFGIPAHTPHP